MEIDYHPDEDYYEILGVPDDATYEELRRRFRDLSRDLHSDVNPSPQATERYKKISNAYGVLKRAHYRKIYDTRRVGWWKTNRGCPPPRRSRRPAPKPPSLRLSTTLVAFGLVSSTDQDYAIVEIHNDGGPASFSTSVSFGSFWAMRTEAPRLGDPKSLIQRLIIKLQVPQNLTGGYYDEHIEVIAKNEAAESRQVLHVIANVQGLQRIRNTTASSAYRTGNRSTMPSRPDNSKRGLAIIGILSYVCGPFLVVGLAMLGASSDGGRVNFGEGLVAFLCFFWLLSSVAVVPHIWWWGKEE